jgi:predicted metal-dependent phosphotriesterase family hydrolase
MKRDKFIRNSLGGFASLLLPHNFPGTVSPMLVTVNGRVSAASVGMVLPHEHLATDFTGAEKVQQPQYVPAEAMPVMLPWLQKLKQRGVSLLVECTPANIGRDVRLLQALSKQSGIHIMTNTGYYAASGRKYLPQHAFTESSDQLAARFQREHEHGIEGSGVKPGFIKLGVDSGPLQPVEQKIIRAAASVHLKTGLKIAIHTGDGIAAREEFALLASERVAAEAFIWVHAQNDSTGDTVLELAGKGCWISLDGINGNPDAIARYGRLLLRLKAANLLNRVLISHDDGWSVIKPANEAVRFELFDNGNTAPYEAIFTHLKPSLLKNGFTLADFKMMMVDNPRVAYSIAVCKI